MVEKKILECKIKNKIRQLLKDKKVKITQLSADLGYNKSFLSNIFHQEGKFFNLEHIEKICAALEYPVAKLFEDDVSSQEGQAEYQADPLAGCLLEMFKELSPKAKGDLLGYAEALKIQELREKAKIA